MSPDESEFVDRMGLYFEKVGGPRTMGRIYGWLMICEPPHQSLTELAAALGVSKASISTVVRQLHEAGMVERIPASTRRHQYRITPGGWTNVLRAQVARGRIAIDAAEFGLSKLGSDRPRQREQLAEFRDFFSFLESDADALVERWEAYQRDTGGHQPRRQE